MTKLTKNQQASIVYLFSSGTCISNIAEAYRVDALRIEDILRKAMTRQAEEAVHS